MNTTCHPSGSAPLGTSLHSFRWFFALVAALVGLCASANTVTYTITGNDGTHRIDATFTVDDSATYYDQWGYRTYYNVPNGTPRAVKAGFFTVTNLATGQIVERGVADTTQWSYFHVLDCYGNTDWLIFVIYTASGFAEIDVFWDNLDAFSGFTAPTSFAVPATRLYAWTPTFRSYLNSVAIDHVDCSQLVGQLATAKLALRRRECADRGGHRQTHGRANEPRPLHRRIPHHVQQPDLHAQRRRH
jgi:hypothetical protein